MGQVSFTLCPGLSHKAIVVGTASAAGSLCVSLWHAHSLVLLSSLQVQEKSEGISHLRGIELVKHGRGKTERELKFYRHGKTV